MGIFYEVLLFVAKTVYWIYLLEALIQRGFFVWGLSAVNLEDV